MNPILGMVQDLSGDRFFMKINLSKGYWQVPVVAEDVPKTVFVTPDGTYEFLRMLFRMVNSGAMLVRATRKLLSKMKNVVHYADDILIRPSWNVHIKSF